ncbi:DUF1016 family protein [archaeon]|jgi:hypothetical protein|nr:DUF1016 family protein [archaeon]
MNNWQQQLNKFISQSQKGGLKTSEYPKEWSDLQLRISFGMGMAARVPWIAFVAPEMKVSRGFYPVYLYYKELGILILAYGVSETSEFEQSWPAEIMNSAEKINAYFNKDVPRYGDSFVFKAYKIKNGSEKIEYLDADNNIVTEKDIEADLKTILDYYKKSVSIEISQETSIQSQGLFYMEKQLEDFIIYNWDSTELGKKYDLIIEEGVLVSQQYRTEIGPIDILARDKKTKEYVIIELKKNQTSDDTIGQIARYMGWIQENKGESVKGVIIAGEYDRRLDYALKMIPNVEVFLYKVNFKLNEFSKKK